MEQKKYKDIERLKDKYAEGFTKGEHILCQEKLDGSNASFCYDNETNSLIAFSRRKQLDEINNLKGFYEFVSGLNVQLFKEILGNNLIIFGEWLIPHTVKYPQEMYQNFYVFDIYDKNINSYIPWKQVENIANYCKLQTVPVFYDGPFVSWEEIYKLIGQTKVGASPCGEGQVVKSQDRLNNKSSRTPEYVKIVAKEFSEVHKSREHKEIDTEALAAREAAKALAMTIVTERRVVKAIEKMVEDDIIPVDWDEHNLGVIAKNLPRAIYNDCVKEEPEIVAQIEGFGKICAGISMEIARGLIK